MFLSVVVGNAVPPVSPGHAGSRGGVRGTQVWLRGAYDSDAASAWKRSAEVKGSVQRYTDEFVACLAEVAQYVFDKHGKFPGTMTTLVHPGFVQAHHIDTEYYDTHFLPGAYLDTHADHLQRWHGSEAR